MRTGNRKRGTGNRTARKQREQGTGNGEPENANKPAALPRDGAAGTVNRRRATTKKTGNLHRLPRLTRSFSLKGWDVTALGNAQGQRMRIHSCMLFSFEALKGRHGGGHGPVAGRGSR